MKTDTYQHNGLNRRVLKVASSETRGFWYNRIWQCVEERVGDFSLLHMRYCWGLRYVDDLIFRECDSKTTPDGNINQRLYAIADPNWNIVAMGANAGSPHERFTYNAFGTVNCFSGTFGTKASASYTTRFFTGQVLDAETGLMLYRNRVYHPRLGRFLQRDPIGYFLLQDVNQLEVDDVFENLVINDVNLFRYCKNNGIIFSDILGYISSLNACFKNVAIFCSCFETCFTATDLGNFFTGKNKGKNIINALGRLGGARVPGGKGSHTKMILNGKTMIIPQSPAKGTAIAIAKDIIDIMCAGI